MSKLVEHHTKYKELHGVDETVWLTPSEHKLIHMRLRRENKCQVPVNELQKISVAAYRRTDKYKEYIKRYRSTFKSKEYQKEYNQSDRGKEIIRKSKNQYRQSKHGRKVEKYYRQNYQKIDFQNSPGKNTSFHEQIIYNNATGTVTYSGRFRGKHGYKLPLIDI